MKKITVFAFLLFSMAAFAQNEVADDAAATPVITAEGRPAGNKTVIKINKDGGSLKSSDGIVELVFPAGAISKKTDISIQPITNLMANGNGKAYRLEPSGIKFQKPVQLIFHYDEEETKDSMQLFLGIAMQDAKGQWHSLKNAVPDTIAKTIRGDINHFSVWSSFTKIKIDPSYGRLKVKKSMSLMINLVSDEDEVVGDDGLVIAKLVPKKLAWRSTWMANEILNGNATEGKITVNSRSAVQYTAPATLPPKNPVAVTAELTGIAYRAKINGAVQTFEKLRLVSNILIYDNAYEVTMISEIQDPSGTCVGAVTYKDTGSFVVSLNGNQARIIERVNKNIAADLNYSGGRCWNYRVLKPGTGNIHIAGTPVIKVTPPGAPGKSALVEISFRRNPAILPLFEITCKCDDAPGGPITSTNGKGVMLMASLLPSYPQLIEFEAKEGEQTIMTHGKPGGPIYTKVTVTQIKDD